MTAARGLLIIGAGGHAKVRTNISTNGMSMTEALAEELVTSGVAARRQEGAAPEAGTAPAPAQVGREPVTPEPAGDSRVPLHADGQAGLPAAPREERCRPVRRAKTLAPQGDPEAMLALARKSYQRGDHNDAFDIYEQLAAALPGRAVPVLAEAYDKYMALPDHDSRYNLYVSRYFDFGIRPGEKVLDIGSGHLPFPFATHLADLAVGDGSVGRAGVPFRYLDGKPVFECSVEEMPFTDREFDFVYCSHVLEHAADPERACRELMRVGRRGYVETPTRGKDLWLDTAKMSNHRWAVEWVNETLVFTEYSAEELEGLQCALLLDMHCSPRSEREKAFSALIYLKANLVNTMVYWEDSFRFEVRRSI